MKVLFDHNLPRPLRNHLPGHDVKTTREMRWERLSNGALLRTAARDGFRVFLTIDKNLRYQQNVNTLPLAVVVLDARSNRVPTLAPFAASVLMLLNTHLSPSVYIVHADGRVTQPGKP